ncbi:MAG: general secretion pathway protein GspK [Deltaproteobacteria bacterium]|nr:general secretion pathway protein GspK [Deltaproteobacteria bacterium]
MPSVLLFVLIVATVAVHITTTTRQWVGLAWRASEKTSAHLKAYSAFTEVAFAVATAPFEAAHLRATLNGREARWPLWGEKIEYGPGVEVSLQDLAGTLSLITSPAAIGQVIDAGAPQRRQPRATDALEDWIDTDDFKRLNGAESHDYRLLGLGYGPRNGLPQVMEEFALMPGIGAQGYERVRNLTSLWSAGTVNPLTMDRQLWEALFGSTRAASLDALRREGVLNRQAFTAVAGQLGSEEDVTFFPSRWVRVRIRARVGDGADELEAVVARQETTSGPLVLAEWRP